MKQFRHNSLLVLVLLITEVVFSQAWACAVCLCGDPSLTVMGVEKPFVGRKRVSLDYLDRTETTGRKGFNHKEVEEQRLTLGFSYTPTRRSTYSITLPWVEKQLQTTSLAEADTNALGDINISARFFLQPETDMPTDMYGLSLGVTLPTAEEQTSSNGEPLDIDVQPGAGSTIPQLGAWYSRFKFPYLFYVSSVLNLPGEGDQGFDPGTSVVTTVQSQYSPEYRWALQLSLDTRWSEKDEYDGVEDPDSGGFLAFLTPGVVLTLKEDLLLQLRTQIPVIDNLNGDHEEEQTFSIGMVYDF